MFNPDKMVIAIRIYYGYAMTPMADLLCRDGVVETIQWNDVKARKEFEKYITGYTLIYDEREKQDWNDWVNAYKN